MLTNDYLIVGIVIHVHMDPASAFTALEKVFLLPSVTVETFKHRSGVDK
jgi:hypothetical protein